MTTRLCTLAAALFAATAGGILKTTKGNFENIVAQGYTKANFAPIRLQ